MQVSIITPTYNTSRFLSANITSILDQSYKNFEHIVVDGGSQDNTLEIVKAYSHIKWVSEPDNGMYEAINKGINMAAGEICAWLNADDRYFPETLELVVREFERNTELDFVYGYCTYISEKEKKICTFRALPFIPFLSKQARITFSQPSCFWKRSVHEKIGFLDSSLKIVGDADFFHRLICEGKKGKLIPKSLSKFMIRDDCLSKTSADKLSLEYDKIRKTYISEGSKPKYYINEGLYYFMNIDSYFKYLLYKLKTF